MDAARSPQWDPAGRAPRSASRGRRTRALCPSAELGQAAFHGESIQDSRHRWGRTPKSEKRYCATVVAGEAGVSWSYRVGREETTQVGPWADTVVFFFFMPNRPRNMDTIGPAQSSWGREFLLLLVSTTVFVHANIKSFRCVGSLEFQLYPRNSVVAPQPRHGDRRAMH
jgi:hypothetical protein